MSSTPADAHPPLHRLIMGVALAAALVPSLVSCSGSSSDDAPTDTRPPAGVEVPVPPDLAEAFTATLDERAAALRDRSRRGFLDGIDRANRGFRVAQLGYFRNLAQLPVEQLGYTLDRSTMVRAGDEYWVNVSVSLQLAGFDPAPVVSTDRFRFAPAEDGRYVVSSVTDERWERTHDVDPQPWDLVPIQVRTRPGVLGIFDDESVAGAEPLLDSVEQGISDVAGQVPYHWSRSVVVYALSGSEFLATLDDVPGGDTEHTDGVAFSLLTGEEGDGVTTRVALNPSMLDRPGPERDRLIRHELTHVALGEHDDRAPLWLAEGIAEWVSVQPLAPELRRLPEEALSAAEAGLKRLPADQTFNDADSAAHYGISWWACEYLATSFGESSLWDLLEALGEPDADQAEVLRSLIGLSGPQLARRGARMMITEYDPGFLVPDVPEPPAAPETSRGPETPATSGAPEASPSGTGR